MHINTYKCDVCGTMKGEKNHWFRIDTRGTGLKLYPWGTVEESDTTVDLCSDYCVVKSVQRYLTEQAELTAPHHQEVRVAGEILFASGRAA